MINTSHTCTVYPILHTLHLIRETNLYTTYFTIMRLNAAFLSERIQSPWWKDAFLWLHHTAVSTLCFFFIMRDTTLNTYMDIQWIFYTCCLTDLAVLIKHTRVPCLAIQSIHPVLDTRTVHIVLCIHHLLLLFNNNTNSLLLRRLLWDWLVASQERWVCTKLPMYVLSTFLLTLPYNCCTTVYMYIYIFIYTCTL